VRNNNCKFCGKSTGQGRRGNPKQKFRGGYAHPDCYQAWKESGGYFQGRFISAALPSMTSCI